MTKEQRATRYWGSLPQPASKHEFFNAVTAPAPSGDGTVATIRMYGPIDSWGGWWGISTKDVSSVLDALPDTVTQINLRINSPGGEVFEGIAILNLLRAHKAKVTAVVDGLAASAASIIAAGCDEVVMSPGTQMMIHSPWVITWGNATDLRKTADMLDGIERSAVEIYKDKAGDKDWAQLLADETWLTATEAVELGLADRVGVVQDAGETATVGDTPDPDDDEFVEDAAFIIPISRFPDRIAAAVTPAPTLPVSSEPGEPNQKEELTVSDTIKAGLRERLGVTDANASDETLLAALDEALTESATPETPAASIPENTVVLDQAAYEELRANAQAGAQARAEQQSDRRDAIVAKALAEGRIAPASRDTWRAALDKDEEGTQTLLNTFPANTVPVDEIGHSDTTPNADAALAAAAGWATTEEA